MATPKYKGPFGKDKGVVKKLHSDPDKEEVIRLKHLIIEKLRDPKASQKAADIIKSLLEKPNTKK